MDGGGDIKGERERDSVKKGDVEIGIEKEMEEREVERRERKGRREGREKCGRQK